MKNTGNDDYTFITGIFVYRLLADVPFERGSRQIRRIV